MERMPAESAYLVNTYRSAARSAAGGLAGTAIIALYAATPPSRSLFHRLDDDEIWHFYGGDPLRLVLLHPDGSSEEVVMGADVARGERVQVVVPAGTWQAGELCDGGEWALFGCTMAPGFDGSRFHSGYADDLTARYPDRVADIARLGMDRSEPARLPDGYS